MVNSNTQRSPDYCCNPGFCNCIKVTVKVNQIAKRANETRIIYEADVADAGGAPGLRAPAAPMRFGRSG